MIRKIRLITKFMTSQPGKQTIAIHILPYVSRSKDNQTVKFGQLIKHNMRNIFLVKSYPKCSGETSLWENWANLWINSLKFNTVYLYCMPS